jgi:mono/diheme cytochrome c family protein
MRKREAAHTRGVRAREAQVRGAVLTVASLLLPIAAAWAEDTAPVRPQDASLFMQLVPVFQHPRCANCHPPDPFPRQGDDQHRHRFGVLRGPGDRGAAGAHCSTCHGTTNNSASGVPGAPDWQLAPLRMAWAGLPPAELCRLMKDPQRGALPMNQLIAHLQTGLVRWAWSPGLDARGVPRSTPPIEYTRFLDLARAWAASGATCPAS